MCELHLSACVFKNLKENTGGHIFFKILHKYVYPLKYIVYSNKKLYSGEKYNILVKTKRLKTLLV